ncbi:MAG: cobaltochelatase subunit CobN [Methylobacter sp.]
MKTLHSYYSNGGRANFAEFFCQVHAQVFKHATRTCLPPQIFPDAGIYHPDYTGRVFPTLEDYLAWKSHLSPTRNTVDLSNAKPSPEGEGWVRGNQNKEKSLFVSPHPNLLPEGEGARPLY